MRSWRMNIVHFAIGLPTVLCIVFVVNIHSCLVVFDSHTSIYILAQPWLVCFLPLCSVHRAHDYHSVSGEMVANGCHQMTVFSPISECICSTHPPHRLKLKTCILDYFS